MYIYVCSDTGDLERDISRTYSEGETTASGVKILKTVTGGETEGIHVFLVAYGF